MAGAIAVGARAGLDHVAAPTGSAHGRWASSRHYSPVAAGRVHQGQLLFDPPAEGVAADPASKVAGTGARPLSGGGTLGQPSPPARDRSGRRARCGMALAQLSHLSGPGADR